MTVTTTPLLTISMTAAADTPPPWALSLILFLRDRLLLPLLRNSLVPILLALKYHTMYLAYWFWTAKVPLRVFIGIPALLVVIMQLPWLLAEWVDFCTVSVQAAMGLGTFFWLLPGILYRILLTDELVDSPFLLWAVQFWKGFYRGLRKFFRGEVRVGGDEENEDDGDEAGRRIQRDPTPERPSQTPHNLTQELHFWYVYYRHTLQVLLFITLVLTAIYVLCNFLVSLDSRCGTSFLCGGPKGTGEYGCLGSEDAEEVIRRAMGESRAPLKYRFFADGTRMQFPGTN